MNERQFADELGALIDNRRDDLSGQLPPEDAVFAARLLALRDQTYADDTFAAALEARLKAAPRPPFRNRPQILSRGMNRRSNRPALRYTQGRLVYTMATFAAALVIVAFAVLTVPSLRSLTQTVYDQVFARPTQTEVIAVTVLPQQRSTGYILATAPLSSGFHVLGRVLHYDDFAVSLLDQAFTSYVNLMSSVSSDSVSS